MTFANKRYAMCLDCQEVSPHFLSGTDLRRWKDAHACQPCPFCGSEKFEPSESCTEQLGHLPRKGTRPDGWARPAEV